MSPDRHSVVFAARLLDEIGEAEDIRRLRTVAKTLRSPAASGLGRGLARRLAPVARIHDLGHIEMRIGDRSVDGSTIRRRVLGLVCFLLTRPGYAATRDQVLEALWPDQEPSIAVNSLNQTVYFLRRVFEEGYREDESANYVHHDGEVVRLDNHLVDSTSGRCSRLIERASANDDPAVVASLSLSYTGRFAMDFEYEDWSAAFRETLHAAYLATIERAVQLESESGSYARGAVLARRALGVDPDAENLEGGLVRLYRASGLHAAAAEQQSHYSSVTEEEFEPAEVPTKAV